MTFVALQALDWTTYNIDSLIPSPCMYCYRSFPLRHVVGLSELLLPPQFSSFSVEQTDRQGHVYISRPHFMGELERRQSHGSVIQLRLVKPFSWHSCAPHLSVFVIGLISTLQISNTAQKLRKVLAPGTIVLFLPI